MTKISLNNLYDYLSNNIKSSCINYIGIGSAARLSEKNINILSDSDMHQYPPFLQNFHKYNLDIPIRLILIDEGLEEIPYIVSNYYNNWDRKNNIFFNKNQDITVISINENIYYDYKKRMYDDKTIKLFSCLNNYMIQTNNLMFVHDFSGNNISLLAEYYENENIHKNILYDIGLRQNNSCYIDLDNNKLHPIIENGYIFNPFYQNHFLENNQIQKNNQIKIVIKYKLNNIKITLWSLFRRIFIIYINNNLIKYDKNVLFTDNILNISNKKIDTQFIKNITEYDFCLYNNKLNDEYKYFKLFKGTNDLQYLNKILILIKNKIFDEIKKIYDFFNEYFDENKYETLLLKNDPYKWIDLLINPIINSCY